MHSTPDRSSRVTLPFRNRELPAGARVTGATPASETIRASLIVKRKQPLDLRSLRGRHLTREEFSSKYAADPAAFDQLRAFASQHGLSADESASSLDRRTLVLSGTVEQMQQAFQTEIQQVEYNGHRCHIHKTAISLPKEYAPLIDAVLGLDTRPQAKSHLRKLKDLRPAAASAQSYLPQSGSGVLQLSHGREWCRRIHRHYRAGWRLYHRRHSTIFPESKHYSSHGGRRSCRWRKECPHQP